MKITLKLHHEPRLGYSKSYEKCFLVWFQVGSRLLKLGCTQKTGVLRPVLYWVLLLISIQHVAAVRADVLWSGQAPHYLEQLLKSHPVHLHELDHVAVRGFYQERKYKPLWVGEKGKIKRAYDLLSAIIHADNEGLDPSNYYLAEIRKYWNTEILGESIYLELLLTAALQRYSKHVYSGRSTPGVVDENWHIRNNPLDSGKLLRKVASSESIEKLLVELPPRHSAYQSLKKQLKKYRLLAQQGGWHRIDPGPVLKPGVRHRQVVQLRQRLKTSRDLVVGPAGKKNRYDQPLKEAVMRFQVRHGLTVDGHVGPKTRAALNIGVQEKIRQVRVNMERWRWMPRKLGDRYLMVNMMGFELYIVEKDTTLDVLPIIIGKSYRSTPSFSGRLSYMEYNPYWTLPKKLALKDYIPRQIRDASFFERKSIRVFRGLGKNQKEIDPKTVNWRRLNENRFPYWLRQDPGPRNALGRIKFLFSNPYDVYLHDTPDKYLFDRVVRTFSSGCIRVKDPIRLAAYLLNDSSQNMEEKVLADIHLGATRGVSLPRAVPIYLAYWTAWVDMDGAMNFREDIYGRDEKLASLFQN